MQVDRRTHAGAGRAFVSMKQLWPPCRGPKWSTIKVNWAFLHGPPVRRSSDEGPKPKLKPCMVASGKRRSVVGDVDPCHTVASPTTFKEGQLH